MKRKCLICNVNLKHLINFVDRPYELLYCPVCSLVVSDPMPSEKSLEKYYQAFQYKAEAPEVFKAKVDNVFIDAQWLINNVKPFKRKGTLLDYGGGIGIFSYSYAKLGFKVTNIDIDIHSAKFNKKQFGSQFRSIATDPYKVNLGKFDYVFCREVIEHVPNPSKMLKNIKRFMHEDSILILTTPNQMSWEFPFRPWWWYRYLRVTSKKKKILTSLYKFLKKPWICCDPPRHLYAFNVNNIEKLLEKEKFEVIKITTRYTHQMHYSGANYHNWQFKDIKSIQRILSNIYSLLGFRLIKLIDRSSRHGIDIKIYAKLKSSVE